MKGSTQMWLVMCPRWGYLWQWLPLLSCGIVHRCLNRSSWYNRTQLTNQRAARNNYICTIGLMHSAVTVFYFSLSLQEAGEKAVMFFLVLPESPIPVAFIWPAIRKKIPNFIMPPKCRNGFVGSEWFRRSQCFRHGSEISQWLRIFDVYGEDWAPTEWGESLILRWQLKDIRNVKR